MPRAGLEKGRAGEFPSLAPHPAGICAQGRFGITADPFPTALVPAGVSGQGVLPSFPLPYGHMGGGKHHPAMPGCPETPQDRLAPHKSCPSPSLPCSCASGRGPHGPFPKNKGWNLVPQERKPGLLSWQRWRGCGCQENPGSWISKSAFSGKQTRNPSGCFETQCQSP